MVMDADAVEARLLTTGGECGDIRQRSPNRHSEIDADPRHQTEAPSFSRPTIRGLLENENRAKRFLPCNPSTRDSFPCRNRNSRHFSSEKPESAHALGNIGASADVFVLSSPLPAF